MEVAIPVISEIIVATKIIILAIGLFTQMNIIFAQLHMKSVKRLKSNGKAL